MMSCRFAAPALLRRDGFISGAGVSLVASFTDSPFINIDKTEY
ncbi:hypothetical protein FORC066_2708 [Yersinia enterocolitica]|nr:hypothetical protein FORC066_2708 [Yersinia enterocolitica]